MVSTNKRKDIYTCNGTGPYVITFPVEYDVSGNAKNIKAQIDENDPLASDKYTVTGLNVSTVDSYDSSHQITIYRETPALQTLDYQSGGGAFDLDTLEKQGLDRAIYMIQERLEEIERTLKAPISDPAGTIEIPGKTTRASTHLAFDADGDPIASEGIPNVPVTAWAATLLDDETLLAAQKTLGLLAGGASSVISAFIQSLLDDADAGTARSTLGAMEDGDLDSILDGSTYQKVHSDYVDVNGKIDSIKESGGKRLLCKVIEIGDWNMDGTASVTVAHGIADHTKIRSISAVIRHDNGTTFHPLLCFTGTTVPAGVLAWDATLITLQRESSGYFDNVNYDQTSYNRGWITIWYEE